MNLGTREARALALLSGNGLLLGRFLDATYLPSHRVGEAVFASPSAAGILTLALSVPALIGVIAAYLMLMTANRRLLGRLTEGLAIFCCLGLCVALLSGAGSFLALENQTREERQMLQVVRPGETVTCFRGDCTVEPSTE